MNSQSKPDSTAVARSLLLAADNRNTALAARLQQTSRRAYSVYGHDRGDESGGHSGFNGAYRERAGFYLLGSHRTYNTVLMHFHSPDQQSPFLRGGLNAYAYCLGDPVNHVDPSGRIPKWVMPVIGIGLSAAGVGLAVYAVGSLISAAAGAAAATASTATMSGAALAAHGVGAGLGLSGAVTGLASTVIQAQGGSKTGEILGYVSLGLGAASLLSNFAGLAIQARRAAGKVTETASDVASEGLPMNPWANRTTNYRGDLEVIGQDFNIASSNTVAPGTRSGPVAPGSSAHRGGSAASRTPAPQERLNAPAGVSAHAPSRRGVKGIAKFLRLSGKVRKPSPLPPGNRPF